MFHAKFFLLLSTLNVLCDVVSVSNPLQYPDELSESDPNIQNVPGLKGVTVVEGDILIKTGDVRTKRSSVPNRKNIWTSRQVPYTFFDSVPESHRQTIRDALAEIEGVTCLKFTEKTDADADFLKFYSNTFACFSYFGKIGGEQVLAVSKFFCRKGNIIHEVLHALGFFHEQSRPDRDQYIRIISENIKESALPNFAKYEDSDTQGTPYDLDSIMHYPKGAFAREKGLNTIEVIDNPDKFIGQRLGLSQHDIEGINILYDCATDLAAGISQWSRWLTSTCGDNCQGTKKRHRFCFTDNCPSTDADNIETQTVSCLPQDCGNNAVAVAPQDVDFESGNTGSWINEGVIQWAVTSGQTKTLKTGPDNDHTAGFNGKGHYLYMEAGSGSSTDPKLGDRAVLKTTVISTSAQCRMTFWYHMYGSDVGRLVVKVGGSLVWAAVANQGQQWFSKTIGINSGRKDVAFVATRNSGYLGDIAIDDITFTGCQ